ncbi:hypothetical protein PVAP13_9NG695614 [Panicum virgatum]|uniref:Uncharacterized protein n=1 Tax=Panicum virgatum TaxID=38727 RepID=A0A8T0N3S6_PANVG|nr:hypothetical protein PVAP13_9NG695614 [Panicum virgatum]
MTDLVEALSPKFEAFDAVMQKILDKVTGLKAWRSSADISMTTLLSKADDTAARLQRLEVVPPPPPLPVRQAPPPPPPSAWVNPFDLNMAPDLAARPFALAEEWPGGHRQTQHHRVDGDGILGSPPPRPVTAPWLCCRRRSWSFANISWVGVLITENNLVQAARFSLLWTVTRHITRKMIQRKVISLVLIPRWQLC